MVNIFQQKDYTNVSRTSDAQVFLPVQKFLASTKISKLQQVYFQRCNRVACHVQNEPATKSQRGF